MQIDKIFEEKFKKLKCDIELGPWVTGEQSSEFPKGVARFIWNGKRASFNFVEAVACMDVLNNIDESEDVWPVIENFSKESVTVDPWKDNA